MSLNKASAISYNNGRGYSQEAIGIIQNFAGAITTGQFDNQTVEAVYKMQQSPKLPFKFADGKVGPNTLGLIIMELDHVGRVNESAVLRNYSYTIQGAGGDVNPIVSFMHWTPQPLMLRTNGAASFSMWGVFSVSVKFTNVDPTRYEYRQRIRGHAWGRKPGGSWEDLKRAFEVPSDKNVPLKGIHATHWKEDGQIRNGGAKDNFGHREKAAYFGQGISDYYPGEAEYFLQDTFGFQESTDYVKGTELEIAVDYAGCIIDKQKPSNSENDIFSHKEVFSKLWSYYCFAALP
jgi:hypothetical protein